MRPFGDGRVEDDLRDAFAVAQVDEHAAAVITAIVHPAHQDDFFADIALAQRATAMRALLLINEAFQGECPRSCAAEAMQKRALEQGRATPKRHPRYACNEAWCLRDIVSAPRR